MSSDIHDNNLNPREISTMAPKPKHTLLTLPPELLLRILSPLPLRPLLTFSLASHYCLTLSHHALPDLAFAIFPSRVDRNLALIQDPGTLHENDDDNNKNTNTYLSTGTVTVPLPQSPRKSNRVTLLIPQAEKIPPIILIAFHDALQRSILTRYATSLRVLDLSIWRLWQGVAAALSELRGLVSLGLEVSDPFLFRGGSMAPRTAGMGIGRVDEALMREEEGVWETLGKARKGLQRLRLGGVKITAAELGALLGRNWGVRELWLKRCEVVLPGVWSVLREWRGKVNLTRLGLVECGVVSMDCLEVFGDLDRLQVSFLIDFGCRCFGMLVGKLTVEV